LLAELAPQEFCAAFSRGTDESDGETRIIGHGDQGRFAVTRKSFNTHLCDVHGLVGFEIVERAARSPRPGAERAPIVHFARLPFVHEPDDALSQAFAVVRLHAGWNQDGVAPTLGEHLLLPRWSRAGKGRPLRVVEAFANC